MDSSIALIYPQNQGAESFLPYLAEKILFGTQNARDSNTASATLMLRKAAPLFHRRRQKASPTT